MMTFATRRKRSMKPPLRFASFFAPFDLTSVAVFHAHNFPTIIPTLSIPPTPSLPRLLAHLPSPSLQRLSPQELSERNKRMKRAIDLSLKHTYLAHDVQKIEGTPYRSYLEIEEVRCSFCLRPFQASSATFLCGAFCAATVSDAHCRFAKSSRSAWRTSRSSLAL